MRKCLLAPVFLLLMMNVFSQPVAEERIQDSVIGWWKKLSIPQVQAPSGKGKLTTKQREVLINFIKWMQLSYTPVGGIGTYQLRSYGAKEPSFEPSGYGVDFRVWDVSFNSPWVEPN